MQDYRRCSHAETTLRLAQVMADVFERFGDRPALGERAREFVPDPATGRVTSRLLPRYETISYTELWGRVRAVAAEWPVVAGDRVALLGFTSADYATLGLVCGYLGAVSVPLQTGASVDVLASIAAETEPVLVCASVERLDVARELVWRTPSVRRLLVFDYHPRDSDHAARFAACADLGVEVVALEEVVERGAALPEVAPHLAADGEDPLAMLLYTSGSTGTPKGAIYTERLATVVWEDRAKRDGLVSFNYAPLSHIGGHYTLMNGLARGGMNCFTAGSDLSTFFEDIALVRPTEVSLVPRVCEMLHQRYQSELERTDSATALTRLRTDLLGGRIVFATCGSAPLSAALTSFVESLLDVPLFDMYGSTEVAGMAVNGMLMDPPVLDYKIVDVPELGYFRTDTPHPRGELRVKADWSPGYYRQPELTAELFDEDGFYRTGDIVAELGPRRITVVDRLKSVLKLSQGEFVALARLESVFAASPLVQQIFLYGNSERSHLVAVVVPTAEALGREGLPELLAESFREIARAEGLQSYEVPRGLLVEPEPFSQANGLLSDQRKLLSPKLVERYGPRLEELYAEIADREAQELLDVARTGRDRPVVETVQRAVRALLAVDVLPSARFRDLGGDSLSAVSLSTLLHDTFGVRVPVDVIISPANDLAALAGYVEAKVGSGATRPAFASVHGADAVSVSAADLTLDRFLDTVEEVPAAAGEPRCVLLTGASGYLGRFLTLEWLQRLAPLGGKVIAVVRGQDPVSARQRLVDAFGTADPELTRTFEKLAASHLEVVAGDIAEPRLGLSSAIWDRLVSEVDLIVHAGALVNHVLPYSHLFDANVLGTAELIRLALTSRLKPVTYVSSVAVSHAADGAPLDEDADVRSLPPQPVDAGYASGYTTSKWAGEVLLREAHDRYGLPVTVFRSTMILAHSSYAGQHNAQDMFSRLLFSLRASGVAPRSFYRSPGAHYDGLPVDFTASSIVRLGDGAGYRTFNLVNPHDDGVSLDTFVGWLIEDGHPIELIDDYADWLVRVEAALRGLPESQRQHTILPLLHGFQEPVPSGSPVPSARFHEAVGDIPHLTRSLLRQYSRGPELD
ncbi:carboxylic acid reductase [Lentzea sp. JNUCC 0626]|uniref:carboxylic acid reductase n=1 Tax=Lentzea sp. JNUCC 0626 TaxID=3367513 RepID=UPI003748D4F9